MENYLLNLMIAGGLLMFFVVKVVGAVDQGGEIKKTAADGFVGCIQRLFK
jgi:hypothetical protein